MIYTLPVRFDANEWFALASIVILVASCFYFQRHLPPVVIFIILLFNSWLGRVVDNILGTNYPYNFYDAMDTPNYDLFDAILWTINYPLYGYLYVNVYQPWRSRGHHAFSYILVWALLSVLLEWVSVMFGLFTYKNWNLVLSFISYLIIFALNLMVYQIVCKLLQDKHTR